MPEEQENRKSALHRASDAVADAAVPKKENGGISWKKFTTLWGKVTFLGGVIATVWYGFNWLDDKLESIENSSKAIETVQEKLDQHDTDLTEHLNKFQKRLTTEFSNRDNQDAQLQRQIDSVRQEMRARHGVFIGNTTAPHQVANEVAAAESRLTEEQRQEIREAALEDARARIGAMNARPQADPLGGLNELR